MADETFIEKKAPQIPSEVPRHETERPVARTSTNKTLKLGNRNFTLDSRIDTASSEADIYLVTEDGDSKKYVLKYYRPRMEPNENVIQTIKSLPESCAIKIVETGRSEAGRFYEIQEYASEGSFQEYIKSRGPFEKEFIKDFVVLLSECVSELHSRNIIHRDIKPANILIRRQNPFEIVLTDYGISSLAASELHHTSLSRTITYSSPESMTGIIAPASDYWAIGMIALELLLQRHPFQGIDDRAIMFTIATKPVPGIEKIKDEFEPLIKGLLTRDPQKRWGQKQIKAWYEGDTRITIHFEETSDNPRIANIPQRKYRPYKIAGGEYFEIAELSLALANNWPQAVRDYEEGRLRDWFLKEARDTQVTELLKIIDAEAQTTKASTDEKLFEFLLRVNTDMDFIFKGFKINKDFLIDASSKILKGLASVQEKSTLAMLINKKILVRFYEINGNIEFYESEYKQMCEECLKFKTVEDFAKVITLYFSEPERLSALEEIENIFENHVIVKPVAGYEDVSRTIAAARKIYKEKRYTMADLVKFSGIDRDVYKTKEEFYRSKFDRYYLEVSEKCLMMLENRYSPVLMTRFDECAFIDWKFARTMDGKKKGPDFYSCENYMKILKLGSAIIFIELHDEIEKILKDPVLFDISRNFQNKGFDDKLAGEIMEEIMIDCDEEYYLKLGRLKFTCECIDKTRAKTEERLINKRSSESQPSQTINFGNNLDASERILQAKQYFQVTQINQNFRSAGSTGNNPTFQNNALQNYYANIFTYSQFWHRVGAYIIDTIIYIFFVFLFFIVTSIFLPWGYDPYHFENFSN
ncbi:MAG TPA: protein kinase, partial [Candidatus Wallbacteria bacterium]|nr:protein kinase [Candidatus Wallbacteria bacterium]